MCSTHTHLCTSIFVRAFTDTMLYLFYLLDLILKQTFRQNITVFKRGPRSQYINMKLALAKMDIQLQAHSILLDTPFPLGLIFWSFAALAESVTAQQQKQRVWKTQNQHTPLYNPYLKDHVYMHSNILTSAQTGLYSEKDTAVSCQCHCVDAS